MADQRVSRVTVFEASFRRRIDHDRSQLTPPAGVLVAIDVAKVRNQILIELPGSGRRRRLSGSTPVPSTTA